MSFESLIIFIAGLFLLTELGLKRLIVIAKLVKELQATIKGGELSEPPRLLKKDDSKRGLDPGGP